MEDRLTDTINRTAARFSSEDERHYIGMKTAVRDSLEYLHTAMFPQFIGQDYNICRSCDDTEGCASRPIETRRLSALQQAADRLMTSLEFVLPFRQAYECTCGLLEKLPEVEELLRTDVQAAYEGDPAAKSTDEIILAYPAFQAISIFRIAHELYVMNIPTVPRMMTEYAHELTGIDIHPGATIGPYFFIDHGTGVVIGETTTIGSHVKLYQHVTLGAKSFAVEPDGSLVKGIKRHPDIGNNVVIYSSATILGGNTRIGDNSIIGGNVWLTSSVEPNMIVTANPAGFRERQKDAQ